MLHLDECTNDRHKFCGCAAAWRGCTFPLQRSSLAIGSCCLHHIGTLYSRRIVFISDFTLVCSNKALSPFKNLLNYFCNLLSDKIHIYLSFFLPFQDKSFTLYNLERNTENSFVKEFFVFSKRGITFLSKTYLLRQY